MKKNTILLSSALLIMSLFSQTTNAQNSLVEQGKDKAESIIKKMAKSNFDSTYVALPEHKWMVFTSFNASYNKYHQRVPMPGMAEEVQETAQSLNYPALCDPSVYIYDMDLHNSTQSASIGVAYRTVRVKYSFNISKGNDKQLSIESLGSRFGFMLDYRRTKKMKGEMYDVNKGNEALVSSLLTHQSDPQSQLIGVGDAISAGTTAIDPDHNDFTLLHLQGHYVFNYKKFSYSAGRTGTRIQKKSAGSPIVLADFYQSRAKFKSFIIGNEETYRTWKVSVGGGYGYNWTPNAGKFMVQASVIPTVSLFSNSTYKVSLTEENLNDADLMNYVERIKKAQDGTAKLTLNCTARLSALWNIDDRWVVGAYGSYQYSNYANKADYSIKENYFAGSAWVGFRF